MFKNKVMIMHMINAYLFIFKSVLISNKKWPPVSRNKTINSMAWPRDTTPLCFNHRLRRKGRRHDSDGEHTPVCVESDRNVTLASTQRLFIDGRHWSIPRSISVERKASFISAVDNTVFEISFHGLWEQVDTWLTYLNRTLIKSSQPESRIWFHTDTQRDAARPSPAASTARAREGKHVAARKKKKREDIFTSCVPYFT